MFSATHHPSLFGFVRPSPLHVRFRSFPAFEAEGVGIGCQQPDPLPKMGSTHISSAEHAPPSIIPCRRKVLENDAPIVERCKAVHVFEEEPRRSALLEDAERVRPEVAGVKLSELLPGSAESLAGDSARKNVN
jgi:hypothetical protein